MKVNECMCHEVLWVTPNTTVCECADLMAKNKIGCIPVCNTEKNVVGIVTDRDILLRGVCCNKDIKNTPISEIMSTNVCCCDWNEPLVNAEAIMSNNQVRRLPVIQNNKIIGMLSIGDISRNPYTDKESYVITIDNICRYGNKNNQ